ncbi:hypothetical protein RSAG8_13985, partial [Rhizoctonia solani AG-8 WAC10335]
MWPAQRALDATTSTQTRLLTASRFPDHPTRESYSPTQSV